MAIEVVKAQLQRLAFHTNSATSQTCGCTIRATYAYGLAALQRCRPVEAPAAYQLVLETAGAGPGVTRRARAAGEDARHVGARRERIAAAVVGGAISDADATSGTRPGVTGGTRAAGA